MLVMLRNAAKFWIETMVGVSKLTGVDISTIKALDVYEFFHLTETATSQK